jgi:hypothetical protein
LKKEFEYIRKTFFSRWHPRKSWAIRKGLPPEGLVPCTQAWCDRKKREIGIRRIPRDRNSFYSILIHEMCHAVTNDYHGRMFQTEMLRASQKAEQIGNRVLRNMVRNDVKRIKEVSPEF